MASFLVIVTVFGGNFEYTLTYLQRTVKTTTSVVLVSIYVLTYFGFAWRLVCFLERSRAVVRSQFTALLSLSVS